MHIDKSDQTERVRCTAEKGKE